MGFLACSTGRCINRMVEATSLCTPVKKVSKEWGDTPVKEAMHFDSDELDESDKAASLTKQAESTTPEKIKQEDADVEMDEGEGINGVTVKK